MSELRNLIFDFGDVLVSYRWKAMLMDYGLSAEEAERVGREMFDEPDRLWHQFDLGVKSDEEIIAAFAAKYPADAKVITWFIRHGEYMEAPRPEIWDRVHALKSAGFRIYILSNYPKTLFAKHIEYADFAKDLDGWMVSYMLHQCKPDPPIYEALLHRYGLQPQECLFFDDRSENIDGAAALGIPGFLVTGRAALSKKLDEILTSGQRGR